MSALDIPARRHALWRTNPKGAPFVGRCVLCGASGLPAQAAGEPCDNPKGVGQVEALMAAIRPEEDAP